MKTIVLTNPPSSGKRRIIRNIDCAIESKGHYLIQPYDLMLLSGCFPPGCPMSLVDATADNLPAGRAIERISRARPDIIIQALSEVLWSNDLDYLRLLRARFPQALILVLGDALIEENCVAAAMQWADGIIASPLDLDVGAILQAQPGRLGQAGRIEGLRHERFYEDVSKKPRERTINLPRHKLFQKSGYRWPFSTRLRYTTVMTAWGCPYRCSYCTDARFPFVYRPWQGVLDELQTVKKMGISEVYFADKSFGLPRDNILNLLGEMVRRRMNFSWSTYFHPSQYEPEFLNLMARSGCHTIVIGVESANIESLRRFGRNVTAEQISGLVRHAHELGMNVCGDIILGLPDETEQDVRASIALAVALKLDFASFNIATPLPGSSIRRQAVAEGRMAEDEHHFDTLADGNIIGSNKLSALQLVALRKLAAREFYLRPGYLLRRLAKLRTFEQFVIQVHEAFEVLTKCLAPDTHAGRLKPL
ncbi:MAG: B12-binding domain-containing radical SAM protein [Planctomycetes bacterium]|nr:B12-binding domain-containing radical SAM protein [Planctomycetota bacterium]